MPPSPLQRMPPRPSVNTNQRVTSMLAAAIAAKSARTSAACAVTPVWLFHRLRPKSQP